MKKFLPYAFITILILGFFLYFSRIIFQKGYIYHTDVTEGLSVQNLYQRYLYTYSNDIGESLAEKARIPLFYLIFGTFKGLQTLGFDDSYYVKIKIYLLITLTLVTYVYFTKRLLDFIEDKEKHKKENAILIASVLGGFYYVANYWFANRIVHFGLFFTTLTIPVTFYYVYTYLFSQKTEFKRLILLTIFLAVLTPTPHTIFFILLILISCYVAFILRKGVDPSIKYKRTWQLVMFGLLYTLMSLIWILPFLSSRSKPDPVLSDTIVNTIGREANLNNSIRLMGYWLTDQADYFYKPLETPQKVLSYIPFLLAIGAIFAFRKKPGLGIILGILLTLGIFLATSFKPADIFYFWLMFKSPLKVIGWLFREYDKLGLIISYVYALAISLIIYKLFSKKVFLGIFLVIFTAIVVSNLYFFDVTINKRYTPVVIPNDFENVIDFLKKYPADANTIWYPPVLQPFWAKNEEVRYTFTNLITPKPSFTNLSESMNYLDYLFNPENIYEVKMGKALDMIGVKYLIIRRDDNPLQPKELEEKLSLQEGLEEVFSTTLLTVYKNNEYSGLAKLYTSRLSSNEGLDTLKELDSLGVDTKKEFVDYTDKPSLIENINTSYIVKNNEVIDPAINKFTNKFIYPTNYIITKDDGNPGLWTLGSLENKTHAETNFFFKDLGLNINQFDYSKGVAIARDGLQKIDKNKKPKQTLKVTFSQYPNFQENNEVIEYTTKPEDFKYYWNIIRSDRFSVEGIKGLEINMNSEIKRDLIPHFKVYTYDENGNVLDIRFIYSDQRGFVKSIVKLPEGAKTADFSIWTLSADKTPYAYKLSKLEVNDISDNVKPISVSFETPAKCVGNCTVFVRALKSQIGGKLGININDNSFIADTSENQELYHPEKYTWIEIGKPEITEKNVRIELQDLSGFNSVNALVFLNQSELQDLKNTMAGIPVTHEISAEVPVIYRPQILQINPTKYLVTVFQDVNKPAVLAFAKPYNPNWVLMIDGKPQKSSVINGYINGWYFNNLKSGIYTIEYKPQKYFLIGAAISIMVFLGFICYFIADRVVTASVRRSNSHG